MKPGLLHTWPLTRYADRTAIILGSRRMTFREIDARINKMAHALVSLGLGRGHKAAVLMRNSVQLVECQYGIPRAGLATVALNIRLSPQECAFIVDDSESDVLIVDAEFIDMIEPVLGSMTTLKHVIVVGEKGGKHLNYESLVKDQPEYQPDIEVHEDDIERIQYTSGTSGRPKGAVSTFRIGADRILNTLVNLDQNIKPTDVNLNIGPLTHAAGRVMALFYIRGAANVILERFDPKEVLKTIERERVTHALFVPTMLIRILMEPDLKTYDLSSLTSIAYGTAPMSTSRLKEAIQIFGPILRQNYGMTEVTQPITYLAPEDHVVDGTEEQMRRLSSAGKPALGVEVKVVNDDGQPVGPGEIGEILVRSNKLIKEYWKQPEATAEAFRNGWLYTSDMATVDRDGYIYIVDRKNDMIISGGFNIYPREVEEAIMSHAGVAQAAVIGVPDEVWGESVKAFVVPKEGVTLTEAEILEACKERLASFKKPKSVEFMRELPQNAYGKILRRTLKEPYWKGYERKVH